MVTEVEPNNLLITNATVLTLDDDYTIINNGAVAIEGDRITAVGAGVVGVEMVAACVSLSGSAARGGDAGTAAWRATGGLSGRRSR